MNGPGPSTHPDELLAPYVDGSASDEERGRVEAHLERCVRCRDDVQAAAAGRRAARSLPSLDAPGVSASVLEALGAGTGTNVVPIGAGRAKGRALRPRPIAGWLIGGAAGAAAAAAIALFLLMGGAPTTGSRPSMGQAMAPGASPSLIVEGRSYSKSSLDALTATLARRFSGKEVLPLPSPVRRAAPTDAAKASGPRGSIAPSACLVQGGAPDAPQVYLEAAVVEARPAYIAAYVEGAPDGGRVLALVAVSRSDCLPLYFATRRI